MASENMYEHFDLDTGSPPRLQSHKKTWQELRNVVRETRKTIARVTPNTPSNFRFRNCLDMLGKSMTQLYFLGTFDKERHSTLLLLELHDEKLAVASPDQETHESRLLLPLPVFPCLPSSSTGPMSKEELLLRERKRLGAEGITSYAFGQDDGLFVIPANNTLYACRVELGEDVWEVPSQCIGARLDPSVCPCSSSLVAFVHDADLWVTCLRSVTEKRLTYAHKGHDSLEEDSLSAGVPSFVMQEEFDRYTGHWWRPSRHERPDGVEIYHLLYEEVDESDVEILSIFASSGPDLSSDFYRYPRAGTTNAYSTLKLMEVTIVDQGKGPSAVVITGRELNMKESLYSMFPWMEYLVRAGWTPDGKYIYAMLMDRLQTHLGLVLISPECFYGIEEHGKAPWVQMIYEEKSNVWINVHDCVHFFPQTSPNYISFLIASEKSGYRHLYRITSQLPSGSPSGAGRDGASEGGSSPSSQAVFQEMPVTLGPWAVLPKEMWVDETTRLVYFMGLQETPTETHLYVTRYDIQTNPTRLTEAGFSHVVNFSPNLKMFVTVYSSLESPPQTAVYTIQHDSGGFIRPVEQGRIGQPADTTGYVPPNSFQYQSRAGHTSYGLYLQPAGFQPGKRYPTVLFVYGGPQVQMVTNSFKGQRLLRLHTLASEGYVVVLIDGRGSSNRGLQFESHLKHRLGTVELEDQVEGLLWLASQTDCIDLSRVAIHGWSYGGYLSLMGITQRPDIFKVAIAGAPVVSWDLYDTGYTERYLGLPESNSEAYKQGSVLSYIDQLPEGDTRLLLIHGLIDENVLFHHSSALINQLVATCKPHQLQVYPNERHGLRSPDASEHYKATVLMFLQNHL